MGFRSAVLTVLCVSLCALTLEAGGGKDVKKDAVQKDAKDAAKKDAAKDKKFEVPKSAIAGTVKSVDQAKATFTMTVGKKDQTFSVDKATKFYGPKGGDRGKGPAGLKDDCMAAGYQIRVVATADGKTAKDVYLPNRKSDSKAKDKKDKK